MRMPEVIFVFGMTTALLFPFRRRVVRHPMSVTMPSSPVESRM